ncbi:uncharacterized protein LOC132710151 isoform X3 [Pantherophis guttatus]|uniref:Uncharacterized protein LOC132710151 isoform X3 n=1 Tax=Pantherophis guttatus TaxID=94885 RepID=A0ABM3YZT5_PANGU|nr:uncharacterized protein LOC132710151 isoform X3 [Pantherophis guttatus]
MRCKLVYKERTAHLFFEGYSLHHVINSVDFLSLSSLPEQNVLGSCTPGMKTPRMFFCLLSSHKSVLQSAPKGFASSTVLPSLAMTFIYCSSSSSKSRMILRLPG